MYITNTHFGQPSLYNKHIYSCVAVLHGLLDSDDDNATILENNGDYYFTDVFSNLY